jgi:hypothetical protein
MTTCYVCHEEGDPHDKTEMVYDPSEGRNRHINCHSEEDNSGPSPLSDWEKAMDLTIIPLTNVTS